MERYHHTEALFASLPWLHDEIQHLKALIGDDWWPYGVEKNRHVLNTFLRYHHEQGLSKQRMRIEDLFAPETLDEEFADFRDTVQELI